MQQSYFARGKSAQIEKQKSQIIYAWYNSHTYDGASCDAESPDPWSPLGSSDLLPLKQVVNK